MRTFTRLAIVATVLAAAPVLAADPAPAPQAAPVAPAANPATPAAQTDIAKKDPLICQRIEEIGSRLRTKKVCMNKSQWDEQRRSDRDNIERSQVQRAYDPVG